MLLKFYSGNSKQVRHQLAVKQVATNELSFHWIEIKPDEEKSVENVFLDRLALLFARIKKKKSKTPVNVTVPRYPLRNLRLETEIAFV
jgi:hypothetical protein